jgi:hypothetical protein
MKVHRGGFLPEENDPCAQEWVFIGAEGVVNASRMIRLPRAGFLREQNDQND